jgi:hypothetical protein
MMEKINYRGWPNCYRLSNGVIDLVVTGDVGPRVIRLGLVGGQNLMKEYDAMMGLTGGDEWRIYGGHRLWHAPEIMPRTYFPDNGPVSITEDGDVVKVVQPVETTTGIGKEIEIKLWPGQARATLTHRLRNHNLWAVELAPWALSVMAQGGVAVIPLPPRGSHTEKLLPVNLVTMWAYTNMADPRWTWGEKYILLRQDPAAEKPQKIGVMTPDGWIGYALNGQLFVKKFSYIPGGAYPDWGCSVESFTNADMLEIETLGPMVSLAPGAAVEHVEDWHLFDGVPMPQNDADVERNIASKVKGV